MCEGGLALKTAVIALADRHRSGRQRRLVGAKPACRYCHRAAKRTTVKTGTNSGTTSARSYRNRKRAGRLQHAAEQQDNTHAYTQKIQALETGRAADAARIASLQHNLRTTATAHAREAAERRRCLQKISADQHRQRNPSCARRRRVGEACRSGRTARHPDRCPDGTGADRPQLLDSQQ